MLPCPHPVLILLVGTYLLTPSWKQKSKDDGIPPPEQVPTGKIKDKGGNDPGNSSPQPDICPVVILLLD